MADRPFIFVLQVFLRRPVPTAVLLKHCDTQMPKLPFLPPALFDSQMYLLISEISNYVSEDFCTMMFSGLTGSAV